LNMSTYAHIEHFLEQFYFFARVNDTGILRAFVFLSHPLHTHR